MFDYVLNAPYSIFIVTSENTSDETTILLATMTETVANDLVKALDEADTACEYDYAVIVKPIVR
jgi:hypothetical protein